MHSDFYSDAFGSRGRWDTGPTRLDTEHSPKHGRSMFPEYLQYTVWSAVYLPPGTYPGVGSNILTKIYGKLLCPGIKTDFSAGRCCCQFFIQEFMALFWINRWRAIKAWIMLQQKNVLSTSRQSIYFLANNVFLFRYTKLLRRLNASKMHMWKASAISQMRGSFFLKRNPSIYSISVLGLRNWQFSVRLSILDLEWTSPNRTYVGIHALC